MTDETKILQRILIRLNQILLKFSLLVFIYSNKVYHLLKELFGLTSNFLITVLTLIICFYLNISNFQITQGNEFSNSPFFIAIGSTFITILILTYSIALLPIQRSIESFSKSISFIYRNDKATSIIFILISVFSLISFLFGLNVKFFEVTSLQILIVTILLIGITLDLLRWYHRRITRLLEPDYAIQTLVDVTAKFIKKYQTRASFISKWSLRFIKRIEKDKVSAQDIEKMIYLSSPKPDFNVINKLSELTEIAIKALSKNEIDTISISLNALANIGDHYIKARKENLIYFPSKAAKFWVSESNIDKVLNNLYENIFTIAQRSNQISNQSSSIACIRSLVKVTDSIAENILSGDVPQSKDMFFIPVDYIAKIIEDAQNKNLDEIVLQGCSILSQTLTKIHSKQYIIDIDSAAVDHYGKLLIHYIVNKKQAYGNKVLEFIMTRLFAQLDIDPYNLEYTLKYIIDKIEMIFPLAMLTEKQNNSNLMFFGLSVPYDASNEYSFINLIRSSQALNKVDERGWHINPYQHFSDYNEKISMHFRSLGEHNDLGKSVFLWHITYSIKEIIRIHFNLLQKPLTDIHNHIEKLFDRISLYSSFFWVALHKSEKIKKQYVEEICDVICWTALNCYREDFYKKNIIHSIKLVGICISNLSSVIRDYGQKGESKNPSDIADLIIYLWMIRIAAVSKKEIFMITKIDKALNELELHLDDYFDEALKIRYQQFLERSLNRRQYSIYDVNKSIGLLKDLVKDDSFYFIL